MATPPKPGHTKLDIGFENLIKGAAFPCLLLKPAPISGSQTSVKSRDVVYDVVV
jgi:hypothetical protein